MVLQLINCTFTNNTAQYSGSALFAADAIRVSLVRCVFTEPADFQPGPVNTILSLSAGSAQSSSPVIRLTDCRVESRVEDDHLLMTVRGPTSIGNSTVSCQSNGTSLRHAGLPAAQYSASYQLTELSVWSQTACPAGFYRPPSNSRCRLALHGRLADINDSSNAVETCYACPTHARCQDSLPLPDYNYYAAENGDKPAEMLLCPAGYCQPADSEVGPERRQGHPGKGAAVSGAERACTEGRMGFVCSRCDDDHVVSLHFNDYISCEARGSCFNYASTSVIILCCTLFYVLVLLMLYRIFRRRQYIRSTANSQSTLSDHASAAGVPANTDHVIMSSSLIGCLFPLVYFYQLLPSIYPRLMTSAWWLDRVLQFWTSLFHLYPPVFAAGRGLCLDEVARTSSVAAQRYFLNMSVYWSQLAFIVLFFLAMAAVFLLSRGPFTEQNIKMLVTHFLPAFIFFQLFSNVPLLRANLQSLHCVAYNDSSVLFTDAMTGCYSSWQVFSVLYVVVCVAPLCLVIDTAAYLLSRGRVSILGYLGLCVFPLLGVVTVPLKNLRTRDRGRKNQDEFVVDETTPEGLRTASEHSVVMVQSVLIKPFDSYFRSSAVDIGWMTVILVRNFVICLLSSLLQHSLSIQAVLISIFCLLFAVDQIVCRGYRLASAGRLDVSSWLMLTLLATLNVYAAAVYESGLALSTWSAVDWLARVVAFLPLVLVVVAIIDLLTRALLRCVRRCRRTRPL